MSRVLVLAGGVAALVLLLLDINFLSAAEPFDVLIRGGTVYDGSRSPALQADLIQHVGVGIALGTGHRVGQHILCDGGAPADV